MEEVSSNAEAVTEKADVTKDKTLESIEISKKASRKVMEISHLTYVMMDQMKETIHTSDQNEVIAKDLADISEKMTDIAIDLDETLSTFKV